MVSRCSKLSQFALRVLVNCDYRLGQIVYLRVQLGPDGPALMGQKFPDKWQFYAFDVLLSPIRTTTPTLCSVGA